MTGIRVKGLDAFRRALKASDARWPKELQRANKAIAKEIADVARSNATQLGGVHAKAARAITGTASQTSGAVGVPWDGKRYPMAAVAMWGAKRRTGWYAAPRYTHPSGRRFLVLKAKPTPQHPPWVGNTWEAGGTGGPYAINPAIGSSIDYVLDQYGEAVERIMAEAFPTP